MLRSASNRGQGHISSAASVTMAVLTLVITIGAAAWGIAAGGTLHGAAPDLVPASAPAAEFSSARALHHIRVVARLVDEGARSDETALLTVGEPSVGRGRRRCAEPRHAGQYRSRCHAGHQRRERLRGG